MSRSGDFFVDDNNDNDVQDRLLYPLHMHVSRVMIMLLLLSVSMQCFTKYIYILYNEKNCTNIMHTI